jgi:hypothetical protein
MGNDCRSLSIGYQGIARNRHLHAHPEVLPFAMSVVVVGLLDRHSAPNEPREVCLQDRGVFANQGRERL